MTQPAPRPRASCPLLSPTITMVTNNRLFPGPLSPELSLTLTFAGAELSRVQMSPISLEIGPVSIPGTPCSDLITITIRGAEGTYDPAQGSMEIPVTATVSHALKGGFLNFCAALPAGPSTISTPLTTGTLPSGVSGSLSGAPLSHSTGRLTLVASGTLSGGPSQIAGTAIDLTVSGLLDSLPLP